MSNENSPTKQELVAKLRQARALLDECVARLAGRPPRRSPRSAPPPRKSHAAPHLDFDAHERAFIKAHAKGLSGPKKFVLLLAYMTKGQEGKEAQLKDIEKRWNRMTSKSLMNGEFNRFYPNSAKEQGWVNTKKTGAYVLRASWREIFE